MFKKLKKWILLLFSFFCIVSLWKTNKSLNDIEQQAFVCSVHTKSNLTTFQTNDEQINNLLKKAYFELNKKILLYEKQYEKTLIEIDLKHIQDYKQYKYESFEKSIKKEYQVSKLEQLLIDFDNFLLNYKLIKIQKYEEFKSKIENYKIKIHKKDYLKLEQILKDLWTNLESKKTLYAINAEINIFDEKVIVFMKQYNKKENHKIKALSIIYIFVSTTIIVLDLLVRLNIINFNKFFKSNNSKNIKKV